MHTCLGTSPAVDQSKPAASAMLSSSFQQLSLLHSATLHPMACSAHAVGDTLGSKSCANCLTFEQQSSSCMSCRGPLNVQNFFVGASVMFRRALLPVSLKAFLNQATCVNSPFCALC